MHPDRVPNFDNGDDLILKDKQQLEMANDLEYSEVVRLARHERKSIDIMDIEGIVRDFGIEISQRITTPTRTLRDYLLC